MEKIKQFFNRIFNRITVKKLIKLGFTLDEDGTYINGTYKIPNKEGLDGVKFRFNLQTNEMLYLTNAIITNIQTMDVLQAVMQFDNTYQKIKKTNIYTKDKNRKQ